MPQKKIGFNDSQLKADKLIIHNGLTASATLEFVGANPITFRLPQAAGTAGQAMITDGVGNLSFATITGATGATGSATQNLNQTLILGNTASVPILHAPGSAATPSISFISDTNTGIFSSPLDGIGISANGTLIAKFSPTGLDITPHLGFLGSPTKIIGSLDTMEFQVQSAVRASFNRFAPHLRVQSTATPAAPSIAFIGDEDTGIFRAGTDELSIAAGGVESGRFTTQSFRGQDGSVTLPGISFINDADTGLFRSVVNQLSISAGGVESGRFTTAGLLSQDGSAATPSISFIGDTDTGMFRRTGDELNFSIGGTELLRIDADPGAGKLQILNNGSAAAVALGINDNNTGLFRAGTDELSIAAGGVESGRFMTQSFRIQSGSVTLPGISFIPDQDTGMFRQATNVVSIAAGGVESGRFTTQSFLVANGSVAIPSISFISDTDTGIYLANPDQIGFTTGGAIKMFISSSAIRSYVVHRFADGTAAAPTITFQDDTDTGIFRPAADQLAISAGGVESVRFTSAGLLSQDGSAATPSMAFSSATNTGIFRNASGDVAITRAGSVIAYAKSNQFVVRVGSAAVPGLTFDTDADTGLFRPASNQLAISAGGLTASVFDGSTTAGETRLLLFDVDSGTIKRVSVGATDSGGVGFKTLRIPN